MNNKQVMLTAMEAQLLVKENELTTYTNDVFNPKVQELNDSILEWFHQNIRLSILKAEIGNESLTLHTQKDRWANRLDFSVRSYWKNENAPEFQFNWGSGNTHSDAAEIEYGIIIGRVCENYKTIEDLVINNWTVKYRALNKDMREVESPIQELRRSIIELRGEIVEDQKRSFMKPGFSLKLKSYKSIEWVNSTDDSTNDRELQDKPGEIRLQVGRGKYDTTFVREFTVNKKVGYKYDVSVVDYHNRNVSYQLTELQFVNFIDEVVKWENSGAQDRTDRAVQRFNEIMETIAKEKERASKISNVNIKLPNLS